MQVFQSDKVLVRTLFNNFQSLLVFFFYSQHSQQSLTSLQNFTNLIQTFGPYPNVKFFSVSQSTSPQTFQKFNVESVPTIIFTQTDKTILKRFTKTTELSEVFQSLDEQIQLFNTNFKKNQEIWHPKIENILSSSPFIIFIKGTPTNPKCGYTSQLLEILNNHNVEYSYCDIIADEQMRYWLRNYGKMTTYPQVYAKGKLLGGLDSLRELVGKGEFEVLIPKESKRQTGEEKYKVILDGNKNVVFIDGFSFENEKSKEIIEKVKGKGGDFSLVNVKQDEKLGEYLKGKGVVLPAYFESGQQVTNI